MAALPALIIRPEDEQRRLHLTAQLALHDQPENHRLFILIDQFEEIFTLCNDEGARSQLIDNVLYASNVTGGRTIVVLTMRADFYGQCASYPGLRAAISDHSLLIGPLSEDELREVIETPAQLAGGELEPGLMELLLSDVKGQAGALPFLEHALFKLWERRDGRRLTAKAYADMGRLAGCLDAHADEFFTKTLTLEEQTLCRQMLLDLVHPGEGAADTKQRVAIDDLASTDAARVVLRKLADARLITTTGQPEASQAELAHEALINGWRRLGNWVNENREKSRLKERLLGTAHEWQKNSKRKDFLYRGAQLAAAEEKFGSSKELLPKLGREFLEESIAEECRERKETQLQQDRELANLATVAQKERQRAVAESKARRRQRNFFIVLITLLVFVGAIGPLMWQLSPFSKDENKTSVTSAQFSPDGQRVVTASWEGTARLWDASSGMPIGQPMKHDDWVNSAQFSADGQRVVTGSRDDTARLWDASTGKPIGQPMKHDGGVTSAQFSPDGRRVVTASWGTARLWDASTGMPIGHPMKHDSVVISAQFSPDGQRVVTVSWNGAAWLWDASSGLPIGQPMKHDEWVNSAQFSPDGRRVVTASRDDTARLWDASTGKPIGQPMKHDNGVNSAQFTPDGRRIVTASNDDTARLWDASTGKPIGQPMKHDSTVNFAQFSPDGQRVVTASNDGTARLWDASTGMPIGQPMKHDDGVTSAQFSPDGQRVVTASRDGTARLWNASTGMPIGQPMKHGHEG